MFQLFWLYSICLISAFLCGLKLAPIRKEQVGRDRVFYELEIIDFINSVIVIVLVCISIYLEEEKFEIHPYETMTFWHRLCLIYVASTYTYDFGLIAANFYFFGFGNWFHHILGSIGIFYEFYYNVGGGLLVRWLFDSLSNLFDLFINKYESDLENSKTDKIDKIQKEKDIEFLKKMRKIVWFILRMIWYPILSAHFIYLYQNNTFKDDLWAMLIQGWILVANFTHLTNWISGSPFS